MRVHARFGGYPHCIPRTHGRAARSAIADQVRPSSSRTTIECSRGRSRLNAKRLVNIGRREVVHFVNLAILTGYFLAAAGRGHAPAVLVRIASGGFVGDPDLVLASPNLVSTRGLDRDHSRVGQGKESTPRLPEHRTETPQSPVFRGVRVLGPSPRKVDCAFLGARAHAITTKARTQRWSLLPTSTPGV